MNRNIGETTTGGITVAKNIVYPTAVPKATHGLLSAGTVHPLFLLRMLLQRHSTRHSKRHRVRAPPQRRLPRRRTRNRRSQTV